MTKILALIILLIVALFITSWCVQVLWAMTMVPIFGLKTLSYGQAMALFVLCGLLFRNSNVKLGSE